MKWHKPEAAKNKGEPRKMTHSSEMDIFLGRSGWESCSPGQTGENRDYNTKNWLLAPIIQILGQNCTFLSLAANWSPTGQCFNTKKVPHCNALYPWYEDTKSFILSPPKKNKWFLSQKRPNMARNWLFSPNIGIFWLLWSRSRPKNDVNKVPRCFFHYVGVKTFASSYKN